MIASRRHHAAHHSPISTISCISTSRTPECRCSYPHPSRPKDKHNNQLGSSSTSMLRQMILVPPRKRNLRTMEWCPVIYLW